MNATAKDLVKLTKMVEEQAKAERAADPDPYRLRFHVQPPTGWLNDPNGLCEKDGVFHAYFQYAPFGAEGGLKLWGHARSRDLLLWDYDEGPALVPDHPFEVTGAYSGSALVDDGSLEFFYTGNVKREDGDNFDYVTSGREGNTVYARATDPSGSWIAEKRLVMTNDDYPADCTCHVRDPKVWKLSSAAAERAADAGIGPYLMVQGARRRGGLPETQDNGGDTGEILLFSSADKQSWHVVRRLSTPEHFGFMWECPDCFVLEPSQGGDAVTVLSLSPQGLSGAPYDELNQYQSGYFTGVADVWDDAFALDPSAFALWDWGFDYYAPQSFCAEDGRRIVIAWMGMPDEPSYGNDATVARGWQHCLTVPREVVLGADGRIATPPVRELASLRGTAYSGAESFAVAGECARCFDLEVAPSDEGATLGSFCATIAAELELAYDASVGVFSMSFADTDRAAVGGGRGVRRAPVVELKDVRVVADCSAVEVFVNGGETCFSTRYYPAAPSVDVTAPGAEIRFWELSARRPRSGGACRRRAARSSAKPCCL